MPAGSETPDSLSVVDSARSLAPFGRLLSAATVEGPMLSKLPADRPQNRAEIAAPVKTHKGAINLEYVEREWATVGEPAAPPLLAVRAMIENPDSAS